MLPILFSSTISFSTFPIFLIIKIQKETHLLKKNRFKTNLMRSTDEIVFSRLLLDLYLKFLNNADDIPER